MILPTLRFEHELWQKGFQFVCGMDEVGRGSFAGPVVVGAVIFPQDIVLPKGIADSKLLTSRKREHLAVQIYKTALACSIAEIGVGFINKYGIGESTQMAFRKALRLLRLRSPQVCSVQADFVLIDAFYVKHFNRKKQQPIQSGDKICASISAASIIAKVYRDQLMVTLNQKYPQYGFAQNKGYGTISHREAIKQYGLSKIHRKSFNLAKFL